MDLYQIGYLSNDNPVRIINARVTTYPVHLKWLYSCRGSDFRLEETPQQVDSLQTIAVRSMLRNLDSLTPELLVPLPESIKKRIWNAIVRSELDSIKAIQLFGCFATVDPLQPLSTFSKYLYDEKCSFLKPSLGFFDHLNSPNLSWTILLRLLDAPLQWDTLHSIGRLRNLPIFWLTNCVLDTTLLELTTTFARRLAQQAREADLWPYLRCLCITGLNNNDCRDFAGSMSWLSRIESLRLVVITSDKSSEFPRTRMQVPPGWTEVDICNLLALEAGSAYDEDYGTAEVLDTKVVDELVKFFVLPVPQGRPHINLSVVTSHPQQSEGSRGRGVHWSQDLDLSKWWAFQRDMTTAPAIPSDIGVIEVAAGKGKRAKGPKAIRSSKKRDLEDMLTL
ncbi:hypothetical protein K461DRAFT_317523 [Myriangium duriaei CBS 260.36]|uniref:Uncharacterized protein n=1 Tax=Myriangium duriaei CBS 260.36 TaxID=1168546 RepID=A0A9P4MLJ1_9PEZI|nr:hypothetical protein K461DRAFT_317523 [Myriangium duriaei CBS 260.36]